MSQSRNRLWKRYRVAGVVFLLPLISILTLAQSATPTVTTLHSFLGGTDGEIPAAALIRDSAGNFYGTTQGTGTSTNQGTVYEISSTNKETVLHRFGAVPDGQTPSAPLVRDSAGNLYGTTLWGGADGAGIVFKITKSGEESLVYAFAGGPNGTNYNDGANPRCDLVLDAAGNLYGTAIQGGGVGCNYSGCGIIFKLTPDGAETILHRFQDSPDGANPESGLTPDGLGNFYGTTMGGGAHGYGTIYKLASDGALTVLYSFPGPPNGAYPFAKLFRDQQGNLFGTTLAGGKSTLCTGGCGTIFTYNHHGLESVLYSFTGTKADGAQPFGVLVRDKSGNFYGTSYTPTSTNPLVTVFEFSVTNKFSLLHTFLNSNGTGSEGGVILDSSGNLYGTVAGGGTKNYGFAYKLTP